MLIPDELPIAIPRVRHRIVPPGCWRSPSAALATEHMGSKANPREVSRRPGGRNAHDPSRDCRLKSAAGQNYPSTCTPAFVIPAHLPSLNDQGAILDAVVTPVWARPVHRHNHAQVMKLLPAVMSTRRAIRESTTRTDRPIEAKVEGHGRRRQLRESPPQLRRRYRRPQSGVLAGLPPCTKFDRVATSCISVPDPGSKSANGVRRLKQRD